MTTTGTIHVDGIVDRKKRKELSWFDDFHGNLGQVGGKNLLRLNGSV